MRNMSNVKIAQCTVLKTIQLKTLFFFCLGQKNFTATEVNYSIKFLIDYTHGDTCRFSCLFGAF